MGGGGTACTDPQCLYKGALYFTFLPKIMRRQLHFTSFPVVFAIRRNIRRWKIPVTDAGVI